MFGDVQSSDDIPQCTEIPSSSTGNRIHPPFPARQLFLDSRDSLERYWGLIVCSSFGRQAAPFYDRTQKLAASDSSNLVRVRAAEFLGLTGQSDPRDFIKKALERSTDLHEIGLILNSVVLLQDGQPGYTFNLNTFFDSIQNTKRGTGEVVLRRMEYLRK